MYTKKNHDESHSAKARLSWLIYSCDVGFSVIGFFNWLAIIWLHIALHLILTLYAVNGHFTQYENFLAGYDTQFPSCRLGCTWNVYGFAGLSFSCELPACLPYELVTTRMSGSEKSNSQIFRHPTYQTSTWLLFKTFILVEGTYCFNEGPQVHVFR